MSDAPQKNLSPRVRARRAALQAVYQWQSTGQSGAEIEAQFAADKKLKRVDKTLFRALLHQVIARADELDAVLAPLLDRPITQVDPVERAILRMGVYELNHHPEVPWRVVIDQSIELAKCFGAQDGHRYINGILDRHAKSLPRPDVVARTSA